MPCLLDHDLCRLLACRDAEAAPLHPSAEDRLVPLLALCSALVLWLGLAVWV